MGVDLVLFNGKVFGSSPGGRPEATAIAARAGRIAFVGDDESALGLARERGSEPPIDLKGARVLPGLVDAHLHFADLAMGLRQVKAEAPTLAEALERVAERARDLEPGAWILGYGWNHNAWGGAFPTAASLDRVAPRNPVCLQAKSGHAVWVNSAALAAAGVRPDAPDPEDGKILRDPEGKPSGVLLEGAMALVTDIVPKPGAEEVADAMAEAVPIANRLGLTGVHDLDGAVALAAHQILRSRGQCPLRAVKSIPLELLDQAIALGLRTGLGDEGLRIGPVKMFADGAMGPRTAWMLSGYEDAPEDRGICVTPPELLREAAIRANAAGLSVAVHAIGDRANRETLDLLEAARAATAAAVRSGKAAPLAPNRIEHAQVLSPADIGRFAELGVVASMQPIHATSEIGYTERHLGARSAGAYAFKSVLRSGAVLALGSDCPVETMDPLAGIHAAATRRDAAGEPGPEGWRPAERLTVAEAVRGYSLGPAIAAGWAERTGSLEPGKLADMTVLERDILEIDPMEIPRAGVLATVVGGRLAWRDPRL